MATTAKGESSPRSTPHIYIYIVINSHTMAGNIHNI